MRRGLPPCPCSLSPSPSRGPGRGPGSPAPFAPTPRDPSPLPREASAAQGPHCTDRETEAGEHGGLAPSSSGSLPAPVAPGGLRVRASGRPPQDGPHRHSLPAGKAIKSNTFQPQSVTCATSQNPEKNTDNLGEARPSGAWGQEGGARPGLGRGAGRGPEVLRAQPRAGTAHPAAAAASPPRAAGTAAWPPAPPTWVLYPLP